MPSLTGLWPIHSKNRVLFSEAGSSFDTLPQARASGVDRRLKQTGLQLQVVQRIAAACNSIREIQSVHKASRIAIRKSNDSGLVGISDACFAWNGAVLTKTALGNRPEFLCRAGVFPGCALSNCSNLPQTPIRARNSGDHVAMRHATRFISSRQAEAIRGPNREFVFARHVKQ